MRRIIQPRLHRLGAGRYPDGGGRVRAGALDFIEKPFRGGEVVERVKQASSLFAAQAGRSLAPDLYFPGREPLTRRERDVLGTILNGASAKEAGRSSASATAPSRCIAAS